MNRRWLILGWLAVVPAAWGQNIFVTVEGGAAKLVKQVDHQTPMVETGGKLVAAHGEQYGLARAKVYRPGFVSIEKNFAIGVWHREVMHQGSFAYELRVEGHLTSDTTFRHCFVVLDLVSQKEKSIAFAEIPDLNAGEVVQLNLVFPARAPAENGEGGPYRLHIFSDGAEVLHSKMRPVYVEAQKKRSAELLAGQTQDFPALLAFRIAPVFPEALKKSGTTGSALVRCHVTKSGDVATAELISATAPAFGEAALAAARRWQFDPAVKKLLFVEADVEIPVEFEPPPKS